MPIPAAARTAALLETLADCSRDYDLSVEGTRNLLRLTAQIVRDDPPTPEEFGRRFMEKVREVRLSKNRS